MKIIQVCNAVYTRFNFTQPLCACADRFQGPCSASIARNDFHTIEVGMKKNAKVQNAIREQANSSLITLMIYYWYAQKGTSKTGRGFKSPTLVKTCEETKLIRECRSPQDWALLALQNVRTGKSQYLVICRCEQGELGKSEKHILTYTHCYFGVLAISYNCGFRHKHGTQNQTFSVLSCTSKSVVFYRCGNVIFTVYINLADGPMSHDQPAYARVPGIRVYGMMCNSGNGTNNRNKRIQRSTGKINISTSEKKKGI